ncbi:rhamnan synthesis F family protein [Microbacterium sp.]|uniref:rhamnan synthesis F family protein n=1 Tax=Microbacterium sp. TaxID=51671 RepID=UPI003F9B4E86
MTVPGQQPERFPTGGKRLVIYVVYDRRGGVEEFVRYALDGMREDATHIIAVVNGSLDAEGRALLEGVTDEILVRSNEGFDIWAHKEALDHVGDRIGEFDEVLLTNDTWFGPVRPYGPVFERMNERAVHFWGMTDHEWEPLNKFTNEGELPYHLQSFWIAVRKEMFLSPEWQSYWRELPPMPSYFDAVLKHETQFTQHFDNHGYSHSVAFASADYPTEHPALFNPDLLIADGCPLVKRRPFFHYPPFLDRHAVTGRRVISDIAGYGYPIELMWSNLARNVQPKTLNTDAGMLEVLPDVDTGYDRGLPFRIAVIAHCADPRTVAHLLDRIVQIPVGFDLFVTTTGETAASRLRDAVDERHIEHVDSVDIRVVPSKHGRDMSAFFVGCGDVLRSEKYDLVVKIHTRAPRKRGANIARYFRRYQLENLLSSPGQFASLLALFQREPGLGAVFPPMMHIGYAVAGRGWSHYREPAEEMCKRLGIRVPFDGTTPLAPMGGMWIGRPEALRLLVEEQLEYGDYAVPKNGKLTGADLARVQERMVPLALGELGYHTRTVLNQEHAGIAYANLAYKLDQLSITPPGYPLEQIQWLHRAGWAGAGGIVAMTRMYVRLNHPKAAARLAPVARPFVSAARIGMHALRTARQRGRGAESEVQQ